MNDRYEEHAISMILLSGYHEVSWFWCGSNWKLWLLVKLPLPKSLNPLFFTLKSKYNSIDTCEVISTMHQVMIGNVTNGDTLSILIHQIGAIFLWSFVYNIVRISSSKILSEVKVDDSTINQKDREETSKLLYENCSELVLPLKACIISQDQTYHLLPSTLSEGKTKVIFKFYFTRNMICLSFVIYLPHKSGIMHASYIMIIIKKIIKVNVMLCYILLGNRFKYLRTCFRFFVGHNFIVL